MNEFDTTPFFPILDSKVVPISLGGVMLIEKGGRFPSTTTSDIKLAGDKSFLLTDQVYLIPHSLVSRKYLAMPFNNS